MKYLFLKTYGESSLEIYKNVFFTAEGISNLLRCLPEMIEFECPYDILVDAFKNLQNTNHQLLKLKNLPVSITSQIALMCKTCPNIVDARMDISKDEDHVDVDSALLRLDSLRRLFVDLKSTTKIISWSISGPRLTCLTIIKNEFVENDFFLLGRICSNLVNLRVDGTSYYELPDETLLSRPSDENEFIFPSLSKLEF